MNLKYEDLHYSDLGASLRNFNDVIKTRKQEDMPLSTKILCRVQTFSAGEAGSKVTSRPHYDTRRAALYFRGTRQLSNQQIYILFGSIIIIFVLFTVPQKGAETRTNR